MRYLLFAGEEYYASGGVADLRAACPSLDEARSAFDAMAKEDKRGDLQWAHILDVERMVVIVLREGDFSADFSDVPTGLATGVYTVEGIT